MFPNYLSLFLYRFFFLFRFVVLSWQRKIEFILWLYCFIVLSLYRFKKLVSLIRLSYGRCFILCRCKLGSSVVTVLHPPPLVTLLKSMLYKCVFFCTKTYVCLDSKSAETSPLNIYIYNILSFAAYNDISNNKKNGILF